MLARLTRKPPRSHRPATSNFANGSARRASEVVVPLAQPLEGVFVLGVEDQHGHGGLVHEELVDEAVVRLPGEIPQPDLPLVSPLNRSCGSGQLRRPDAVGGNGGVEPVPGESDGQPRLADAAVADEEDLGVGVVLTAFPPAKCPIPPDPTRSPRH